jgi:hypothetical protein
MKLLTGDVPGRSMMPVDARLMPVDAWTPACAVDHFYTKADSKKPSKIQEGFSFPLPQLASPGHPSRLFSCPMFHALLTFPEIADILRTSELGFLGAELRMVA